MNFKIPVNAVQTDKVSCMCRNDAFAGLIKCSLNLMTKLQECCMIYYMGKIKLILYSLPVFFLITNCSDSTANSLTRENTRKLLANPPQNQIRLNIGTFHGCVHIPAKDPIQRAMVGFEKTGESCSVTISQSNNVEVSFIGGAAIHVVSTSANQRSTDTFIGELANDQVLIVQHHQGEVVSVTQTIYDQQGHVVHGKSREGDYIRACNFVMSTSEKRAGRKICTK